MAQLRHLRALQAFDAVATCSSFSRAAETLGVTHGAVSRQVKQLEEYLGVLLLHRRATGVEMTAAGAQLHLATQQAFSTLSIGVGAVRRDNDEKSVTISLSTTLAVRWLVPNLPEFRAQFPGIEVFLDTNDALVDFNDSGVDAALRYGIGDWGDLYCERLIDEQLVVVASPALVGNYTLPMTPASITSLPLLHDQFNPAWDQWSEKAGLELEQLASKGAGFKDSGVLIAAALDGQGVVLVRRLLVEKDLDAGRLIRLDNSALPSGRGLYFVCRKGEQSMPSIRSVRNWLVSLQQRQA